MFWAVCECVWFIIISSVCCLFIFWIFLLVLWYSVLVLFVVPLCLQCQVPFEFMVCLQGPNPAIHSPNDRGLSSSCGPLGKLIGHPCFRVTGHCTSVQRELWMNGLIRIKSCNSYFQFLQRDSALHHQSKHQVREYFERMLFIVKIFQDPCGEVMLHTCVIQPFSTYLFILF